MGKNRQAYQANSKQFQPKTMYLNYQKDFLNRMNSQKDFLNRIALTRT